MINRNNYELVYIIDLDQVSETKLEEGEIKIKRKKTKNGPHEDVPVKVLQDRRKADGKGKLHYYIGDPKDAPGLVGTALFIFKLPPKWQWQNTPFTFTDNDGTYEIVSSGRNKREAAFRGKKREDVSEDFYDLHVLTPDGEKADVDPIINNGSTFPFA